MKKNQNPPKNIPEVHIKNLSENLPGNPIENLENLENLPKNPPENPRLY